MELTSPAHVINCNFPKRIEVGIIEKTRIILSKLYKQPQPLATKNLFTYDGE